MNVHMIVLIWSLGFLTGGLFSLWMIYREKGVREGDKKTSVEFDDIDGKNVLQIKLKIKKKDYYDLSLKANHQGMTLGQLIRLKCDLGY